MVEKTRNQVYRQRYRGFESHPLRQKKAHPSGWAFFWHYDPGAGGIRKAALRNMPVACFNRRGFSAEKGSQPLRQLVANYAGILCHRACQLDCNLAAGEHHVNDLLGGFAVSYVDKNHLFHRIAAPWRWTPPPL